MWGQFAKDMDVPFKGCGASAKDTAPKTQGGVQTQRKGWGIIANRMGSKRKETSHTAHI